MFPVCGIDCLILVVCKSFRLPYSNTVNEFSEMCDTVSHNWYCKQSLRVRSDGPEKVINNNYSIIIYNVFFWTRVRIRELFLCKKSPDPVFFHISLLALLQCTLCVDFCYLFIHSFIHFAQSVQKQQLWGTFVDILTLWVICYKINNSSCTFQWRLVTSAAATRREHRRKISNYDLLSVSEENIN